MLKMQQVNIATRILQKKEGDATNIITTHAIAVTIAIAKK
jgi:hypothetical protein